MPLTVRIAHQVFIFPRQMTLMLEDPLVLARVRKMPKVKKVAKKRRKERNPIPSSNKSMILV